MGDRANVMVVDRRKVADDDNEVTGIYLYTHWSGYEWPEKLRQTLNLGTARNRWTDESYLTRIIVAHMYDDLGFSETGGGIGTQLTDNEHEIVVLDIPNQTVAFAPAGSETDRNHWTNHMSFTEFCDQIEAKYPNEED